MRGVIYTYSSIKARGRMEDVSTKARGRLKDVKTKVKGRMIEQVGG